MTYVCSVVSPPNGCKPKEFDRPTSLVNGVMHFVSTFKSCVPFVITGTSKSVLDYFVQYGTRVMPQIGEFVPNAYFGANNLCTYYGDISVKVAANDNFNRLNRQPFGALFWGCEFRSTFGRVAKVRRPRVVLHLSLLLSVALACLGEAQAEFQWRS